MSSLTADMTLTIPVDSAATIMPLPTASVMDVNLTSICNVSNAGLHKRGLLGFIKVFLPFDEGTSYPISPFLCDGNVFSVSILEDSFF
jgi:hypothetical protein